MQKRRIAWALSGGIAAEVVNKFSPLLIMHFAARAVGVQGFGVAQFGLWLLEFAMFFTAFGYQDIGALQVGPKRDDGKFLATVIGETLVLRLGHMLVAGATMWALLDWLPAYGAYRHVLLALSFMLFTSALDMTFVLVATQRLLVINALMVIGKVASLVAIIMLVDSGDDAVRYAVLSAAANGFVSLASFVLTVGRYGLRWPSRAALKSRLLLASPYALHIFLLQITERFDMFLVEHFSGQVGAGLYAAPARLVQSFVPLTITMSGVFFSEIVGATDREARFRHTWLALRLMLLTFLPLVVGVWFVDDWILALVFGPEFQGMGRVFSVLMLTIVGQLLIQIFGRQVLMLEGRVGAMNRVLTAAALVGMVSGVYLVSHFGLVGGALASVGARLFAGVVMLVLARAIFVGRSVRDLWSALAPCLLMAAVLTWCSGFDLALLGTLAVGALSYVVAAALFNFRELSRLARHVQSQLGR